MLSSAPLPDQPTADTCIHSGRFDRISVAAFLAVMNCAMFASTNGASLLPEDLRLVPFPKEVRLAAGGLKLDGNLTIKIAGTAPARQAAAALQQEIARSTKREPDVTTTAAPAVQPAMLWLGTKAAPNDEAERAVGPLPEQREGYVLVVTDAFAVVAARQPAGLACGVRTLGQLVRANLREGRIPAMSVRDWPSLRWRGFQDDITRGPSSTLEQLEREVSLGAEFKLNLFTYYMEHQFAYKKYPFIGPKDGSLLPEDLKALVDYARPLQVEILGSQQSLGHFGAILQHEEFKALRETPGILTPAREESYQLLDDLYSEVVPLLPFAFFNVCCDEADDVGTGQSKPLADQIGRGGVYVRHLRRLHDLLRDKYGKRMMMWGDVILNHPENVNDLPKDTVMLVWDYAGAPSFDNKITPFVKAGHEYFVCPSVANFGCILPRFPMANANIQNLVRDGARQGALGMINTAWDDDAQTLNAVNWHGYAWGAECAWNASATSLTNFNRRVGAVLFGEAGDHFGRATELLAECFALASLDHMSDGRFWQLDLDEVRTSAPTLRSHMERVLGFVRPAIEQLETCRKQATVNVDLLDAFIFEARRMELIGQRVLDAQAAAAAYRKACEATGSDAEAQLANAEALMRKCRDAHRLLGEGFRELWVRENRPYMLNAIMSLYAKAAAAYDSRLERLASARACLRVGKPLLSPAEVGLAPLELGLRSTHPEQVVAMPLDPATTWLDTSATHRVGLVIHTGSAERVDLPVEVDIVLPPDLASRPVRGFARTGMTGIKEIPAQLDPGTEPGHGRLVLALNGLLPKQTEVPVWVYLGLRQTPAPLPQAASATAGPDGTWLIENDKVRLQLAPKGAHVYRWEVKSMANKNLAMSDETRRSGGGFAEVGGRRTRLHKLKRIASGPALVRFECAEASGFTKWLSLFAGCSWMEVTTSVPLDYYGEYDQPQTFLPEGSAPGRFLFSNRQSGQVGRTAEGKSGKTWGSGASWVAKYLPDTLALGLIVPEEKTSLTVDAGEVGIEGAGIGLTHLATYGGALDGPPAVLMTRLQQSLDFRNQPKVVVHALQSR